MHIIRIYTCSSHPWAQWAYGFAGIVSIASDHSAGARLIHTLARHRIRESSRGDVWQWSWLETKAEAENLAFFNVPSCLNIDETGNSHSRMRFKSLELLLSKLPFVKSSFLVGETKHNLQSREGEAREDRQTCRTSRANFINFLSGLMHLTKTLG